jgi:N-methylhydantoinase B
MDHGRFGPQGVLGGEDGAVNVVRVERNGEIYIPPHLSKAQDIEVAEGDRIHVSTPGGGGYGEARLRDPDLIARDLRLGYYTEEQASALWGDQMAVVRRKVEG